MSGHLVTELPQLLPGFVDDCPGGAQDRAQIASVDEEARPLPLRLTSPVGRSLGAWICELLGKLRWVFGTGLGLGTCPGWWL